MPCGERAWNVRVGYEGDAGGEGGKSGGRQGDVLRIQRSDHPLCTCEQHRRSAVTGDLHSHCYSRHHHHLDVVDSVRMI